MLFNYGMIAFIFVILKALTRNKGGVLPDVHDVSLMAVNNYQKDTNSFKTESTRNQSLRVYKGGGNVFNMKKKEKGKQEEIRLVRKNEQKRKE